MRSWLHAPDTVIAYTEDTKMIESFEAMLTGGHPNSLGRTEDVVDAVLADRSLLDELVSCYFSQDEVVRLRVSSAMKRVTTAHPDWTMDHMDRLQTEIAAIDQASNQWTLALLFDLTRSLQTPTQLARSLEIMKDNLEHHGDWIVLNNSMQVLHDWSLDNPELARWLAPQLERLTAEPRTSVAKRATRLLAKMS
jgi:hypothetical protein